MIRKRQGGFGIVTAVIMLVIMAGLSVALVRMSTLGQMASAMDVDRARAYQAAQAGIQWAGYQIFKAGATACTGVAQNVPLDAAAFPEIGLSVTCTPSTTGTVTTYTVLSLGCTPVNAGVPACPVALPGSTYVEQALWARFEN